MKHYLFDYTDNTWVYLFKWWDDRDKLEEYWSSSSRTRLVVVVKLGNKFNIASDLQYFITTMSFDEVSSFLQRSLIILFVIQEIKIGNFSFLVVLSVPLKDVNIFFKSFPYLLSRRTEFYYIVTIFTFYKIVQIVYSNSNNNTINFDLRALILWRSSKNEFEGIQLLKRDLFI